MNSAILVSTFPARQNIFQVIQLPFLARFYRYAYHCRSGNRWQMRFANVLKKIFTVYRRFCGASTGEFEYLREGQRTRIFFDARNVQFLGLYLPMFVYGYEPEVAALIDIFLPEGGIFYDIGSNWGYFTLYAAANHKKLTIHAFEPLPDSYRDLASCVQQAGLSKIATCHNFALSSETGEAFIKIPDHLHSGSAEISRQDGQTRVATRRLDALDLPPPDFIKLDAENHELEILRGAAQTLKTSRPFIVFENKPDYMQPEKVLNVLFFLQELGYNFYVPAVKRQPVDREFFMQVGWHEIKTGENLSLIPFRPETRLLYQHELNVFACHASRQSEQMAKFKIWPES
jgi:FkbM family methyltransferase